jgi:hypothetical protein
VFNTVSKAEVEQAARRFRVCWEAWPEFVVVDGRKQQIGFELELSGTHAVEAEHVKPGCVYCLEVFVALLDIADAAVPDGMRAIGFEFRPYEKILRYSAARGFRPDVALSVKILHGDGRYSPVDEEQERCLRQIQQSLEMIGVHHRSWPAWDTARQVANVG